MTEAKFSRRGSLRAGLGLLALAPLASTSLAAPPEDRDPRLEARLDLWGTYARKTRTNLLARYASTRSSSLLREELVAGGSLAFVTPATLVLRDDAVTGSTTRIGPERVEIVPNDPSLPRRELPARAEAPALRWLADHLVAAFAPGDGEALIADARVEVPRSRTPRLSLLPPRDSAARSIIRSLTLTFDHVGGAIVRVDVAHSDGGVFVLKISDHRQNLEPSALARVLE